MLRKKMLRDIKHNLSQFITIFLMVFIGVLAYSGIESYMMGMQYTADKFYKENNLQDTYTLLGFRDNPYKYVAKCDLFVCSSLREGFSTAVTESLVVGTPVVSTLCSGSQELLGYNNEYGLVVENSEDGIYNGMKKLLEDRELLAYYKEKASERGSFFSKEKTVKAVEDMIDSL